MKNIALIIFVSLILSSCIVTGGSRPLKELLVAPEEVKIEGHAYTLGSYLWRDFMPGKSDSRMIALVRITEKSSKKVLSVLDANHLWVINGTEVWSTSFSSESRPAVSTYQFEKIARDGPEWKTGIKVDVVVQLIDGEGREYLLKASRQEIRATF